jgi:hypothetical protein
MSFRLALFPTNYFENPNRHRPPSGGGTGGMNCGGLDDGSRAAPPPRSTAGCPSPPERPGDGIHSSPDSTGTSISSSVFSSLGFNTCAFSFRFDREPQSNPGAAPQPLVNPPGARFSGTRCAAPHPAHDPHPVPHSSPPCPRDQFPDPAPASMHSAVKRDSDTISLREQPGRLEFAHYCSSR